MIGHDTDTLFVDLYIAEDRLQMATAVIPTSLDQTEAPCNNTNTYDTVVACFEQHGVSGQARVAATHRQRARASRGPRDGGLHSSMFRLVVSTSGGIRTAM